ncbi:MAG: metallophosphoesterase, partial [bacterium]
MSNTKKYYPIVILSDIHLGSSDSHPKKVMEFLKSINFDTLILNGDIIDGWKLKRGRNLRKSEVELLKYFLKISKKKEIIYLRGNHDDFLDHMIPINFGDIQIKESHELT